MQDFTQREQREKRRKEREAQGLPPEPEKFYNEGPCFSFLWLEIKLFTFYYVI